MILRAESFEIYDEAYANRLKRLKAGNAGAGIRIDDLKISDGGHYKVHVKSIIPNSVVVGKGSVELVVYSPEPGIQIFTQLHPTLPYF